MNYSKIARKTFLLPFIIVIILFSCSDDPIKVGFEILPSVDMVKSGVDTLAIECYTVKGMSGYAINATNANDAATSDNSTIGYVTDPVFGVTSAECIMELDYNSTNYYQLNKHDTSDTYLSCKLYLNINKDLIFGGENGFDINIYPLTKQLSYTFLSDYVMKSDDFAYNENPVSIKTVHGYQATNDSIEGIDSGKYYIVVELEKAFGSKFMDTSYINTYKIYSTNFLDYFPGFYLRPTPKNSVGGLNNFYFYSSRMVLEYNRTINDTTGKSGKTGENDTTYSNTKYSTFSITNYNSFFQNSSNNFPNGPFGNMLGDTLNQGDIFYVQAHGGVRGFIKIPELNNLKQQKDSLGINYAELVFPLNHEYLDTINFFNPPRLTLFLIDSTGNISEPSDLAFGGYFKGYFYKETMDYRLNITEFVHQYITLDYPIAGFYLTAPYNSSLSPLVYKYPGRVVLNSGVNINPSYLRVIYTKIY